MDWIGLDQYISERLGNRSVCVCLCVRLSVCPSVRCVRVCAYAATTNCINRYFLLCQRAQESWISDETASAAAQVFWAGGNFFPFLFSLLFASPSFVCCSLCRSVFKKSVDFLRLRRPNGNNADAMERRRRRRRRRWRTSEQHRRAQQ